jgi:hypothetical protein
VIVALGVNFDSYRNTGRASMTMLNSTGANKLGTPDMMPLNIALCSQAERVGQVLYGLGARLGICIASDLRSSYKPFHP